MEIHESGGQAVRSWASILDDQTLKQALMTARCDALAGPLALMPDAHLGAGSTVGSVLLTEGIIPSAVGVDIGCGVSAYKTAIKRHEINDEAARRILGRVRETIPSGVGKSHSAASQGGRDFVKRRGWPSIDDKQRVLSQFGTLGAGNHFAEVSEDTEGSVWLLVHSGSRGIGNQIAQHHIRVAKALGTRVEHPDLSYLSPGSTELTDYVSDMLWAQDYAFNQREAMMEALYAAVVETIEAQDTEKEEVFSCHHNYSEEVDDGVWLSRKGAIDATSNTMGIIPGSMGAATYIVRGKGNADSYRSAPHGAGRMLSRGAARRQLDLEEFRAQMTGRVWDDRNAEALLDEAPLAYKPIETVMEDSKDLVETVTVLKQFINYKGL
jgi:tRNA-splicing ligase RtcB